jgi:hypothetical protein
MGMNPNRRVDLRILAIVLGWLKANRWLPNAAS